MNFGYSINRLSIVVYKYLMFYSMQWCSVGDRKRSNVFLHLMHTFLLDFWVSYNNAALYHWVHLMKLRWQNIKRKLFAHFVFPKFECTCTCTCVDVWKRNALFTLSSSPSLSLSFSLCLFFLIYFSFFSCLLSKRGSFYTHPGTRVRRAVIATASDPFIGMDPIHIRWRLLYYCHTSTTIYIRHHPLPYYTVKLVNYLNTENRWYRDDNKLKKYFRRPLYISPFLPFSYQLSRPFFYSRIYIYIYMP